MSKRALNATFLDGLGNSAPDRTGACRSYMATRGDQVAFVDLYTVTLATLGIRDLTTGKLSSPMVLRWADALYDVVFEDQFYAGGGAGGYLRPDRMPGPRLSRKGLSDKIGTEVTELEIALALDGTDRLPAADGDPATPRLGLAEAILAGLFDGARVELRRLVMPDHPRYPLGLQAMGNRGDLGPGDQSLGAVHMFLGRITGDSEVKRTEAILRVKSYAELLGIQLPWRLYQPGCLWNLYDKGCAVSRTGTSPGGIPFQVACTVTAIVDPTTWIIDDGGAPGPPTQGWFADGTVTFPSGVLAGFVAPVARYDLLLPGFTGSGTLRLLLAPPRLPAVGDTIICQAGCDKVGYVEDPSDGTVFDATCQLKFGNGARFAGAPHVPVPTTSY